MQEVPEWLITRFQTTSLERLERLASVWVALTHGTATVDLERSALRDVHTLKGDARVVGFNEVATLTQRVEEMLFAARKHGYKVPEEFDIVLTMALQFIGMLLRKKTEAAGSGIDLPEFLKQTDEVLTELRRGAPAPPSPKATARLRISGGDIKGSRASKKRLAVAATAVYLEHLRSKGDARWRLGEIWRVLAQEVTALDASPLEAALTRHAEAAAELAQQLGKNVEVEVDAGDLRVGVEVLEGLNSALIHALRNAVDHGIEGPAERAAARKTPIASVSIHAHAKGAMFELEITDDGTGIDTREIRKRAVDKGLVTPEKAAALTEEGAYELLFLPGMSTRDAVSDVSGRGIGLDAVRDSLLRIGGKATITSRLGQGTTLTLTLPRSQASLEVTLFPAKHPGLIFALDGWAQSSPDPAAPLVNPVDFLHLPPDVSGDAASGDEWILHFERGPSRLAVVAGGPARAGTVKRLCATPPEAAFEITTMDDVDVILLRPGSLRELSAILEGANPKKK